MNDKLIEDLKETFPDETERIDRAKTLVETLENENEAKNVAENIEELQQICNDLYNIKGSEHLIELQVIINEFRYKYDVTDPREIINIDNGKGFVQ